MAIETVEGSVPLSSFEWPNEEVVIMVGGEGLGISKTMLKAMRPGEGYIGVIEGLYRGYIGVI